jgi:DNA processing protein
VFSPSVEQRALLALSLVSGVGPRLTTALLEHFGSAQAAVSASAQELQEVPHIGPKLAVQFRQALDSRDVDAELERMREHEVHLLFLGERDYPPALACLPVPPRLLYVHGTILPCDQQAIALVGSRLCTAYGKKVAERLAGDLVRAGYTIVSGLARGIDGAAHRGALQAGGRTIAVLAGGLSGIYPPEHRDLASLVAASGALVSQYNMLMEPLAVLFPERNRIISGLSRAVVVVEANSQSGALITARHAAEQGREVFAVPGSVDSAASAGALELLRGGARLVRHAADILDDLQGLPAPVPERSSMEMIPTAPAEEMPEETPEALLPPEPPPGLDDMQRRIWEFLEGQPRHQDEIVEHTGIPVAKLSGQLLLLEMRKVIRRLPGNQYERFG